MNTNEFGNYLRELRRKRGLTIRDLEAMSGVSNAHLSFLENGKRKPPSPETLHRLAGPLGVSYEELMVKAGHLSINEGRTNLDKLEPIHSLTDLSKKVPLFNDLIPGTPLNEHRPDFWMSVPEGVDYDEVFYTRLPDNGLAGMGLTEGARVLVIRRPATQGDVCVCSTKSQLLIRRMFYVDGFCVLQGTGRNWAPVICNPDDVNILGVVVQGEVRVD